MTTRPASKPSDPHDAPPPQGRARHLRVGIALRPRSARVVSVAVAQGAPVQPLAAGHPLVAVVDVGGQVIHVARFQDPFTRRSTRTSRGGDHHYAEGDEGVVVVSVPVGSLTDLTRSRVRVVDVGEGVGAAPAGALTAAVDRLLTRGRLVRSVGYAEIAACPDFSAVAPVLGLPEPQGQFEVYLDRAGAYRWRLRTPAGAIVAVSGEGFASRAECEADLQWLRRYAATAPVRSLDVPRGPG